MYIKVLSIQKAPVSIPNWILRFFQPFSGLFSKLEYLESVKCQHSMCLNYAHACMCVHTMLIRHKNLVKVCTIM